MKPAREVAKSDKVLGADDSFAPRFARYDVPAAEEAVARTVKALTDKRFIVHVVDDEAGALALLAGMLKDGMEISMGGSTTLSQIGFTEVLKAREDTVVNYKGLAIAARTAGDMAKYATLIAKGSTADVFFSSVSAITEEGVMHACDYSGSRINGWYAAKKLVLVAGTNKIVKDDAAADQRLMEYQYPLESARMRQSTLLPGSSVSNKVQIREVGPAPVSRVTVVLIRKSLGF